MIRHKTTLTSSSPSSFNRSNRSSITLHHHRLTQLPHRTVLKKNTIIEANSISETHRSSYRHSEPISSSVSDCDMEKRFSRPHALRARDDRIYRSYIRLPANKFSRNKTWENLSEREESSAG